MNREVCHLRDPSDWLSARINETIRFLLEKKHLYQSLVVDQPTLVKQLKSHMVSEQSKGDFDALVDKADQALTGDWRIHDEMSRQRPGDRLPAGMEYRPEIAIFIRSVGAACPTCKAVMPMNVKGVYDLARSSDDRWEIIEDRVPGQQDFVFLFQCQKCRSQPDAFLVRRRGMKLTLCGRSPMEYIEVPASIPKPVRSYYSDAVVAANSGKLLAGFLYLRVLIEQHVRGVVGDCQGLKADEALAKYSAQIPEGVREWLPSLRERYGLLSKAIHSASEESDLFSESIGKIETHFKGLEAYEEAKVQEVE